MRFLSSFLASLLLVHSPGLAFSQLTFVTIGTGSFTGVYYPTGRAISKLLDEKRCELGILARAKSTPGSVFNVNSVMSGDMEFGLVQSDRQYQAYYGLADWKDKGKQKKLRAVFNIHAESVSLVAADDSGIKNFMDLRGKRVNIGNPGSGPRGNALDA